MPGDWVVREELRRALKSALVEAGHRDRASHIETGHDYVLIGSVVIKIEPLIEAAMRVMELRGGVR